MSGNDEKGSDKDPDWFRRTAWTENDEKDFFAHLKRARAYSRPQYLRIQAVTLYRKDRALYAAAIGLLEKYLSDFPEDKFERTGALQLLGRIYDHQKDSGRAFEYYRKAAEFEIEYPSVNSGAGLDYAEFIVKHEKRDMFEEAEKYAEQAKLIFSADIYRASAVLSIINKAKGDHEKQKYYRERTEQAARTEGSGLSYHRGAGLVKRDEKLDELMR